MAAANDGSIHVPPYARGINVSAETALRLTNLYVIVCWITAQADHPCGGIWGLAIDAHGI